MTSRAVTIIQMALSHLQFVALLTYLDIDWPTEWRRFVDVMALMNLDPRDIIGDQEVPSMDFRTLFIIVAIFLPLAINLLILFIYRTLGEVLWYGVTVLGVVLALAGAVGRVLPKSTSPSGTTGASEVYLVAGGVLLGISLLCFGVHRSTGQHLNDKEARSFELRFHRARALALSVAIVVATIAGVVLTGFLSVRLDVLQTEGSSTSGIFTIVGFSCLGLAAALLIYLVLFAFEGGRLVLEAIGRFFRTQMLMILMLAISTSFVPILSYCMNMFQCAEYSCPAGTVFNPYAAREVNSYDRSAARFCDPCVFLNTNNSVCAIATSSAQRSATCPAWKSSRNWKNPDIACDDEAAAYFFVAAGIVLIVYLFCIPLLYRKLIYQMTDAIAEKIEPPPQETVVAAAAGSSTAVAIDAGRSAPMAASDVARKRWMDQIVLCRPVAGSLYEPFAHSYRFYQLFLMAYRLAIVMLLVIVAPISSATTIGVLIAHGVAALITVFVRPYLYFLEQALSIVLAALNVLNAVYALSVWREGKNVGKETTGAFIALNFIAPTLITIGALAHQAVSRRRRHRALVTGNATSPTASEGQPQPRSAAAVLQHARRKQLMKLLGEQYLAVKSQIDRDVSRELSRYFMIMGVFIFIALGVAVLGTLRQRQTQYLIGTSRLRREAKTALADYPSWDAFTTNCCCLQSSNPSVSFRLAERWMCRNGKVVDHGRVSRDGGDNSLALRGLCQTTFVSGCSLYVIDGVTSMSCVKRPVGVSDDALRRYW